MENIWKKIRDVYFLAVFLLVLPMLLSGCVYKSEPRESALMSAPGYDVKSHTERVATGDNSEEKLTVDQRVAQATPRDNKKPATANNNSKQPPAMQIDSRKKYNAILKTSEGDIAIELFAEKTPITVNNFVSLAREKFYDGTIFHRVIKDFMIQGGDPNGDGTGGPGYKFDDEPFEGEYARGTVAMANSGPNTNGSQFFIIHKDYDLPKNYVIFGKVTAGLDVVDKIAEAEATTSSSMEKSKPVNPVKINSVEIGEN